MPTELTKKRGVYHHEYVRVEGQPAHAELSPSGSPRWIICSGSHHLTKKLRKKLLIPPDRAGQAAALGTLAHWLGEQHIAHGKKIKKYLGQKHNVEGFQHQIDHDMNAAVSVFTDYVHEIRDFEDVKKEGAETWLSLKYLKIKGLDGGTLDWHAYTKDKDLFVVDYKHGFGYVSETTPQIRIYGCAALKKYPKAKRVHMVIVQPRYQRAAAVRVYTMSATALREWEQDVLVPQAKAVHTDRHNFVISDQGCAYCPAKNWCPAHQQLVSLAKVPFEWLSRGERMKLFRGRNVLLRTLKEIEQQLTYEVGEGHHKHDLKLVRKATQRKADRKRVLALLGDAAYKEERVLKPLSELDALLAASSKNTSGAIVKPDGEPELALIEDPREPMAAHEFREYIK